MTKRPQICTAILLLLALGLTVASLRDRRDERPAPGGGGPAGETDGVMEEGLASAAAQPGTEAGRVPAGPAAERAVRVLAVREAAPDAAGRLARVRLVENRDFKYPLLRIEETVTVAPLGVQATVVRRLEMVADHLVVSLREGVTEEELLAFNATVGAKIRKKLRVPGPGTYLVELTQLKQGPGAEAPGTWNLDAVPEAVAFYRQAARVVAYAEPDYLVHTCETAPNDPDFSKLWGLHNTGQTGGKADADIDALEAWQYTTGSKGVLVGVIDTGIDYTHPDLAANMWTNPGESGTDASGNDKRSNGIDDDGNGYKDDWRGWNFINETNNPMDDHYHGTHVAGTIGGTGNNGVGVVGVCWNVSMVGLKFLSSGGSGAISDAVEAVSYANKVGLHMTSNSWGGGGFSQALKDAIAVADTKGILFVAAAGNSGANADTSPMYPAAYDNPNIISVAATDHNDALASFSNYGATTVDLGAPGVAVYSAKPGNTYQNLSGTSMATPHVSGVCALLKSIVPGMTHADVKARILAQSDPIAALTGKCVTGGRLNALKTVQISQAPLLRFAKAAVSDSAGNGDGLLNPGETVNLTVTLQNIGLTPAAGVNAALSTADAYVTVSDAAAAFGDIAGYSAEKTALDPFQIKIAAACPTPREVTLNLAMTDSGGKSWTDSFKVMVYSSSQISGLVTLDGAPLAGATITYAGPLSGSVLTGGDGKYLFGGIDGTYTLTAGKGDYLASAPVQVTVPPSKSGVNFAFTTAAISGKVTDLDGGAAIGGATVEYTGSLSGSATTAADGTYSISRVFGQTATLSLIAKKTGVYFDSAAKGVTLPPSAPNTNFQLGVSKIAVTPAALSVEVVLDQAATRTLNIANGGSLDLKWSSWNQMGALGGVGALAAGDVKRSWAIPAAAGSPYGVVSDGAVLWVSNYSTSILYKLDLLDGHVVGSLDVGAVCKQPWGLAWDGAKLWIADYTNKKVFAVNPADGAKMKEFPAPTGSTPTGLTFGGGGLWVVDYVGKKLYKLNPESGAVLGSVAVPGVITGYVYGAAYFNGALWVASYSSADGKVFKVNPADGAVLGSFVGPDKYVVGMSNAGGGLLWLSSFTNRKAFLVDTGEVEWLQLTPDNGAVAAKSSANVTVTMDSAKVPAVGTYTATLHVTSNDPLKPDVPVAVTFNVINGPNVPPVIGAYSPATPFSMAEGASQAFGVTATDADGQWLLYTWTLDAKSVASGTVASWTYAPDYSAAGAHVVKVTVDDRHGGVVERAWNVTVTNTNRAPAAVAVTANTLPNTPVATTLSATDPDGDALTYVLVTQPANGTLSGSAPNLTYTPKTDFLGTDGFTYKANDGAADSNTATVTISVANKAKILITCDNGYDLYLNGALVGSGSNWQQMQSFDGFLKAGKNVVAVKGTDAGGVAGLLAEIQRNGERLGSGTSWKASLSAPTGWEKVDFDDSAWVAAKDFGAYGVAPWGTGVAGWPAGTPARWIWSSNNDADNLVYFRFGFSAGNSPPVIASAPTAAPNPAKVGQTVSFGVTATDADNDPLTYAWDFGDGTGGSGPTAAHAYSAAGTFTATVVVSDGKASVSGTVVVTVTPAAYTITASAGAGGAVSPSGAVSVPSGGSQAFSISPNAGYKIADVKVDGVSVGAVASYTFSNVTANHTLAASFAVLTYTLTASAGTGGTVTPSGTVTVNHGGSQTFTVAAGTGYTISDVKVDGASVGAVATYTFVNVTANHTLSATFSAVAVAPSITTQPASQTVNVGQTATFTVVASGTAPLSYQWQKNGANIAGATAASYTTPAASSSDNGARFKVVVTNSAGSVTSNEALLTVNSFPSTGQVLITCDNGYTLYCNGLQVGTGGNWNQMQTYQVNLQSGKNVVAVACTDAGGVAGLLAEVRYGAVRSGTSVSWKVSLSGPAGWQNAGFDDSGWAGAREYGAFGVGPWGTNVAGCPADTPAKWIWSSNNDADNLVYVRFTFDNGGGQPPSITQQPASATVAVGQAASFSVVAVGTAPLGYQWQKNGVNIAGATGASYTTPATTLADNASKFRVAVTNSAGSVLSNEATLTVTDAGGAVLWWRLDDGSGTQALDSSGKGNVGTVSGAAWVAGKSGGALSFDGIDDLASRAGVTGLGAGNSAHTVCAWIKVNALPASRAWILQLGNDGSGSHHWLINSSGGTQFGVWNGSQVAPALPVGQWRHVAVTHDGTTLTGYVNGASIGSKAGTFNLQGMPLTLAQRHINENYFNGSVDDLRIYPRALTAAEVGALAAAGAAGALDEASTILETGTGLGAVADSGPTSESFQVTKARVRLDFSRASGDLLQLEGWGAFGANAGIEGREVRVTVGGLERHFLLDASGRGQVPGGRLRLVRQGRRLDPGGAKVVKIELVLTGNLKAALARDGLTAAGGEGAQVSLMTTLSTRERTYVGSRDGLEVEGLRLNYSVRGGVRGLGELAAGD